MKVETFTQEQAKGFFKANTKYMVIEFILPDVEEPLEITGSRGVPISNGSGLKRLDQLSAGAKGADFGDLFDNYDSRKKEKRLGFLRFIPAGREADVLLRITTCNNKSTAKTISKYLRNTKLNPKRTIRRDVMLSNVSNVRMVNLMSNVVVDAGTSTNLAIKVH